MFKHDVTLGIGLTVENAVLKVDNFSGHAENMTFWVNVYLDVQNAENGSFLERKEYNFSLEKGAHAKEIYMQAYDYLKSLPEYENATDV